MSGYAAVRRVGYPAGWWGMAMFVASEAMLFGAFVATYFYLRFKTLHWPPPGIAEPKLLVPLVLLGVLLLTSAPVQRAARAAQDGQAAPARRLIFLALLIQAAYLGMQVHLYAGDLDRFTPQDNAYGSIYFTLLGAAHAHVALGLLFDLWLLVKLARGLTSYRVNGVRAVAFYWHAVNVITLLVTLTILSPAI